jgi:hypothetical protein
MITELAKELSKLSKEELDNLKYHVVKKRTILNGPDAVAKLNGTGGA